ncbi:MAG: GntR family transcriptional regulator [Herminiimonas sp.]|nr:GntR family transcriptional regulator [Herminiimonas sp.]
MKKPEAIDTVKLSANEPETDFEEPLKTSQTDMAVDLIRSKIVDLTLEPSSRINESLLIDQFKLGRTPAREAINRLVAEGLVKIVPNRGGTFVRSLDFFEIGQVIGGHRLTESILGQLCDFDDLTLVPDLLSIQKKYIVEVKKRSYLSITAINASFHLRMHKAVGNSFFYDFAETTHRHARRLLVLIYKLEASRKDVLDVELKMNVEEHHQIIAAIESKDRKSFQRMINEHAKQTQQRLMKLLESAKMETSELDLTHLVRGLWSGVEDRPELMEWTHR